MVFNELGDVAHVLRLSIADQIYQLQTYDPGQALFLEDEVYGVTIQLPVSATLETKPIAIGWGGTDLFSGSSQLAQGESAVIFDILPYGLELDEQAIVSVPYSAVHPQVQLYDEEANTWITIEDVVASDGYVTFSTQTFGRFKVSEQGEQLSDTKVIVYEDHGYSCFIEAARGSQGSLGSGVLPATLAALFSCAAFRKRSVQ
jgi:hypothetical protein